MAAPAYTRDACVDAWARYLRAAGLDEEALQVAQSWPERRAVVVDYMDVSKFDSRLADHLQEVPAAALSAAADAIASVLPPTMREALVLRPQRLPPGPFTSPAVRSIRSAHLHKLIAVRGTVRRVSEVRPKLKDAVFQCVRCGARIEVEQEGAILVEPLECYEWQGGCKRGRGSTKFELIAGPDGGMDPFEAPARSSAKFSSWVDFQAVEIQEPQEGLRGGEEPRRLTVHLEDDLTGRLLPGDTVVANGLLRERQEGRSCVFERYLRGVSVEREAGPREELVPTPEDERAARAIAARPGLWDDLVASVAPAMYGLKREKEALVLQLFGGVPKTMPDGTRIRGDAHVLVVGDPGLGKSQLLLQIARVAERAFYVAGKSASAAGLTAAAVQDDDGTGSKRWVLEAGAFVLADGGMLCADELDKMEDEDRDAMHEAMEQQTVTVSKAGIHATLNTRAALLGAANPKWGRFDPHTVLAQQINMPPALLSRFDLILALVDEVNRDNDRQTAEFILGNHRAAGEAAAGGRSAETAPIPAEDFRRYVAFARQTVRPLLSPEASSAIRDAYVAFRAQGSDTGDVTLTARQLEGFVRLAEARAKADLSPTVTGDHARFAVALFSELLSRIAGEPGARGGQLKVTSIDGLMTGYTASQRKIAQEIEEVLRAAPDGLTAEDLDAAVRARGVVPEKIAPSRDRMRERGEVTLGRDNRYRYVHG